MICSLDEARLVMASELYTVIFVATHRRLLFTLHDALQNYHGRHQHHRHFDDRV